MSGLRREHDEFVVEAMRAGARAASTSAEDGTDLGGGEDSIEPSLIYRARFAVLALGRRGSPRKLDAP